MAKQQAAPKKNLMSKKKQAVAVDISNILNFFQGLFKKNLRLSKKTKTSSTSKLVGTQSIGSKYIYELLVEHEERLERRRMSVGPLGEDSGSKSNCYYVIYDDHIVIKVPPVPITDFKKYIDSIRKDRLIANRVNPRECVIPGVSVILKRVHLYDDRQSLNTRQLEERYFKLLNKNQKLQNYLKIGNSFVYFMDLATHFMFADVLTDIQSENNEYILEEISEHFLSVSKFEGFEERYGRAYEKMCSEIKTCYVECEDKIKKLLTNIKISPAAFSYKMPNWYALHVAGQEIGEEEKGLSIPVVTKLNQLINSSIQETLGPINTYRTFIRELIVKKRFMSTKIQMGSIISNILELLAFLEKKHVAMRDLKPDNLLIVGERNRYPQYLKSPHEFMMGLIDVETAVALDADDYKNIKQPQIGGTPFYATPSHLLKNDFIIDVFENLPRILHLQDWFAGIVMIYNVVVGERLFAKTARLFPPTKNKIKSAYIKTKTVNEDVIKEISKDFWSSALDEFRYKTGKHEKQLSGVDVIILEDAKNMLREELKRREDHIAKKMQQYISSQTIFKDVKKRRLLFKSDYNEISQLKAKWESGQGVLPSISPEEKANVINLFDNLLKQKMQVEQQEWIKKLLKQPEPVISAFALLKLMFNIILFHMYKEEWGPLTGAPSGDDSNQEFDDILGVTML